MCIAIPGRVLEVNNGHALVDFSGNIVEAQAGLVSVKPGDRVLVHAGCILQVMSDFDSQMLIDLLKEIEAAAADED